MKETVQQYVQRIGGYIAGQEPLKVQAATPRKLERLVAGASAAKLRKRPAPDKWSVVEILAHLADVEIAIGWRVRAILGAPGTPVQAYDQDAWAEAGRYAKRNPRESVALMRAVRAANLALYKSLFPEQWKHYGLHAERGQETVEQIVRMVAGHDLNHLQQIERILAATTPAL
ncbi:MAG: DinB family protein [Terriglobales bacterium]